MARKNMYRTLLILLIFNCFATVNTAINIKDTDEQVDTKALYIDLMKHCVTGIIYEDKGFRTNTYDLETREHGLDWPQHAHTMIGLKRLDNLEYCVEDILKENIPGDFFQTGTWRGGSAIFLEALLVINGIHDRNLFVADSFEGIPVPDTTNYPMDNELHFLSSCDELKVSLEQVKNNFFNYGLLKPNVKFIKGRFSNTLPNVQVDQIALLHLDGDLYESTWDAFTNLYPKLSIGGYVVVDDYGVSTVCKKATLDYRAAHNISDPMHTIDDSGAIYWKRSK